MSEIPRPEIESTLEAPLDKGAILDKLFQLAAELGLDIDEDGMEGLLGEDDNDFLGNLATLAVMNDFDHETFFGQLGIPLERTVELGE